MKLLNLIIALVLTATAANAQTYTIRTGNKSGNWHDAANWTITSRNDGKNLVSFVIPANTTITVFETVDLTSLGTVELEIAGTLEFRSNKSLLLSSSSVVNIKAGGSITLDANAKNDNNASKVEQLKIGNSVKFDGNLQSGITGPATATSQTANAPSGFSANAMLPVTFVAFTATKANEDAINLSWTTTDEINNSHFEIQRSTDGTSFKSIAIVMPADDNSNTHLYKYTDRFTAKGTVYYRVRQVDNDGKDKFSTVKVIGGAKLENEAQVYVTNKTVVIDLKNMEGNVMIRIVGLNGSVISQKSNVEAAQKVSIPAYNAASGAYVVQISDLKGSFTSKKILL